MLVNCYVWYVNTENLLGYFFIVAAFTQRGVSLETLARGSARTTLYHRSVPCTGRVCEVGWGGVE